MSSREWYPEVSINGWLDMHKFLPKPETCCENCLGELEALPWVSDKWLGYSYTCECGDPMPVCMAAHRSKEDREKMKGLFEDLRSTLIGEEGCYE